MDWLIAAYILTGWCAGLLGSMVGLGGGIIVVPALTLLLNVNIKNAVSSSLISLVATSVMSVSVYAERRLVHYRLGLVFVFTTILGSFLGSYVGVYLDPQTVMICFAVLIGAAIPVMTVRLFQGEKYIDRSVLRTGPVTRTGLLELYGRYPADDTEGGSYYRVRHAKAGAALSTLAGAVSGLLGVGGGIIQVPMLNGLCGVPVRVATATSAFMIGFTGLAGATTYFLYEQFDLSMTGAVVVGVTVGSWMGSRLALLIRTRAIVGILIAVLVATLVRMVIRIMAI